MKTVQTLLVFQYLTVLQVLKSVLLEAAKALQASLSLTVLQVLVGMLLKAAQALKLLFFLNIKVSKSTEQLLIIRHGALRSSYI